MCIRQNVKSDSGAHPVSCSTGTGVERGGAKLITSLKLKNELDYTSTLHIHLKDEDRNKFTFCLRNFTLRWDVALH